jgi:hypothetical protein
LSSSHMPYHINHINSTRLYHIIPINATLPQFGRLPLLIQSLLSRSPHLTWRLRVCLTSLHSDLLCSAVQRLLRQSRHFRHLVYTIYWTDIQSSNSLHTRRISENTSLISQYGGLSSHPQTNSSTPFRILSSYSHFHGLLYAAIPITREPEPRPLPRRAARQLPAPNQDAFYFESHILDPVWHILSHRP